MPLMYHGLYFITSTRFGTTEDEEVGFRGQMLSALFPFCRSPRQIQVPGEIISSRIYILLASCRKAYPDSDDAEQCDALHIAVAHVV